MIKRIMSVLDETVIFEDSVNWFAQAPTMAKNLERILFHQENNLEDYINEKSLYDRLELIARARMLGNSKEVVSESSNKKINESEIENIAHIDGNIITFFAIKHFIFFEDGSLPAVCCSVPHKCGAESAPAGQRLPAAGRDLAWAARTGSGPMWMCGDIFAAARRWRGRLLTTGRLSCRHPVVV